MAAFISFRRGALAAAATLLLLAACATPEGYPRLVDMPEERADANDAATQAMVEELEQLRDETLARRHAPEPGTTTPWKGAGDGGADNGD
jgi:hypothetical protein